MRRTILYGEDEAIDDRTGDYQIYADAIFAYLPHRNDVDSCMVKIARIRRQDSCVHWLNGWWYKLRMDRPGMATTMTISAGGGGIPGRVDSSPIGYYQVTQDGPRTSTMGHGTEALESFSGSLQTPVAGRSKQRKGAQVRIQGQYECQIIQSLAHIFVTDRTTIGSLSYSYNDDQRWGHKR
ncbi:hypothetical protein ARMSODRAFT_980440 [Armillaria solidipes]|uniref:Uncharacterized protein n=1 Tax=Armillaria solidipes TaxID=1076256 RepID=A0A2H3B703_9AGAR|nr:hypothetical protein ARMSODRAFT_980440 [Armillaria solidipes]